jgi:hypothetical protein
VELRDEAHHITPQNIPEVFVETKVNPIRTWAFVATPSINKKYLTIIKNIRKYNMKVVRKIYGLVTESNYVSN